MREAAISTTIARAHGIVLVGYAALLGLFEGPAEIACVLALGTTLARGGLKGWRPGAPELGIAVWLFAGALGAFDRSLRVSTEDALRPLMALAFIVGARGIPNLDDRSLRRAALAFVVACVLNGAYGYLQLGLGELPFDRVFLKNPTSTQIWVPDHIGGTRGVSGLFYHRLKLAHVGIVALALIGLALVRKGGGRRLRVASALGFLVLGGAVVLTYARMALVAFAIAALITVLLSRRVRVGWIAGVMVLFAGFVAALSRTSEFARERIESIGGDWAIRRAMFDLAISMFKDHPICGVGHGAYRGFAEIRARPGMTGVLLTSAHNLVLQVLAETGIVGLLGFGAAAVVSLHRAGKRIVKDRDSLDEGVLLDRFALFGFVAILVLGATHSPLHHAPVALVFWTLLGVLARDPSSRPSPIRRKGASEPTIGTVEPVP